MNSAEAMQTGAVDEIATTDAQIEQLREQLRRLNELSRPLFLRISEWKENRPFRPFLRLPREIREIIRSRHRRLL